MIDENIYKDLLKTAFNAHYKNCTDEWTSDNEMRSIPSLVQGYLKLKNKIEILDIGCGAGKDVDYFAKLGHSVIGLDIYSHDNWIKLERLHSNVKFICSDFLDFKFENQFDFILDSGCFHHQHPDMYAEYIAKIYHLIREKGRFVVSTFKSDTKFMRVDSNGRIHKFFDDSELSDLLLNAGFVIDNQIDIYRAKKKDYYRLTFAKK